MSDQFLFFCTNIGNEILLKEELRVFYPELKLSYSRKGFLTFKNTGIRYDLNTISQLDVAFSTRVGICEGKCSPDGLASKIEEVTKSYSLSLDKCAIHSFAVNTDYILDAQEILHRSINEHAPINKTVLNLITLSENEIWVGIHKVALNITSFPNSNPGVELPDSAPSRAYLKIAETSRLFNIPIDAKYAWFDFGSAPGGVSYLLLEKGCKVWGIDPAKMAPEILENPNYTHFSTPVQDLSQEDLPFRDMHWAYVDLNLNPKQSIKEVLRLCKKYNFSLKGIILNVKLIKLEHVKNIRLYEEQFEDWGFTSVISRQIPSHKKEYAIIAKR